MCGLWEVLVILICNMMVANSQEELLARQKRYSVSENYQDEHCEDHFKIQAKTIIHTQDSLDNGARFVNESQVNSMSSCLHYCCSLPGCNAAIFDIRLGTNEGGSCYGFDCVVAGDGGEEEFRCLFTPNSNFSSAVLSIDRFRFDIAAANEAQGHQSRLEKLRGRDGGREGTGGGGAERNVCGQFQFQCSSGECIAVYDTCNTIKQCRDGSDEDPQLCPSTAPPTRHQHLRPDMDVPIQKDSSIFRHKYDSLPPDSGYRGGWGSQQSREMGQGYQDAGGDDRRRNYGYSQGSQGANLNNMVGGQPQMGPDYIYQNPPGSNVEPYRRQQYPMPQYPIQFGQPYQGQQYGGQYPYVQAPHPVPEKNRTETTTEKLTKKTNPSTRVGKTSTSTTTTTASPEEKFEAALIASLGDELKPMQTPGMALFTLSVGVLLTVILCVIIVCRLKRGKMGFRRGLAHDADGDYLVNGMYL